MNIGVSNLRQKDLKIDYAFVLCNYVFSVFFVFFFLFVFFSLKTKISIEALIL